jgi:hypothetical protein
VKPSNKVMAAEFCFIGHIVEGFFFFFWWVEKNRSCSADIYFVSLNSVESKMGACLRYMHTLNYDELIFLHFFMMKVLWEGLRVERIEGI